MGDLQKYATADITDLRQFTNFDEEAQLIIEKGETPKMLQSANSQWFLAASALIDQQVKQAEKVTGAARSKEFVSTITDLKILSALALYYGRRIPAAVYYRIYDRTKNAAALDTAIVYENKAVDAWRQIVVAAGDVYTTDLMMGLREADLCGHWKDGLLALEKDLTNLAAIRASLPQHAVATANAHYTMTPISPVNAFSVQHQPVVTASAGKPLSITVKVTAKAGVKWVRLKCRSVNQEAEYKTIPMTAGKEKDIYTVTVPAADIEGKWDFMYFIEMMDNNHHGRIYPDLNQQTPYFIVTMRR